MSRCPSRLSAHQPAGRCRPASSRSTRWPKGATARQSADKAWLSDIYGWRGWLQEQVEKRTECSHLPMSWLAHATLDWSWAFVLTALDGGRRTRFHFRSRWTTSPWWLTLSGWVGIVPADFITSRDMLRGVKMRAEHAALEQAAHSPGVRDP